MPTITHFFKTYFPDSQGGVEEVIRQIARYSIRKGFDVNVISVSKTPQQIISDGIYCKSFKHTFGVSTMPISLDLYRSFKEIVENTDIIHLHYPYPFVEMLTLFSNVNKPIIVTFHGEIEGRKLLLKCYSPFIVKLFKKADIIVPTSNNLAHSTPILRKFSNKLHPINLWIDKERFPDLDEVDDDFKQKISGYGRFALFVGALRWYKGLNILLDAAKNIRGNIIVVGKGPELENLKKRKEQEGLNNIILLGFQSDLHVAYLFSKCFFFVLPSQTRAECFGVVLLEAAYYKKALLSTELGTGTSWANEDGISGFVIPPADSIALAEKMNYLFEHEEECHHFGERAFERYNLLFTASSQAPKYIELYNSLLSHK